MLRIGINGLGRIGKTMLLIALESADIEVCAINCNIPISKIGSYLNHDSVHGNRRLEVRVEGGQRHLRIGRHLIAVLNSRDPKELNWRDHNVDTVIEATGSIPPPHQVRQHSVDQIIITAPAGSSVPTFCYGVNHTHWNGEEVVSGSSCTSNCLAPLFHVVSETAKIESAHFITVHAATQSQSVQDSAGNERGRRSIINNIIPHKTGASKSIEHIIPALRGRITGSAVRVPTPSVSMVEVLIRCSENVRLEKLLNHIRKHELYNDVLVVERDELVSSDFKGNGVPCIIDEAASQQIDENVIKIVAWYDNEWSYSTQTLKLARHLSNNRQSIQQT